VFGRAILVASGNCARPIEHAGALRRTGARVAETASGRDFRRRSIPLPLGGPAVSCDVSEQPSSALLPSASIDSGSEVPSACRCRSNRRPESMARTGRRCCPRRNSSAIAVFESRPNTRRRLRSRFRSSVARVEVDRLVAMSGMPGKRSSGSPGCARSLPPIGIRTGHGGAKATVTRPVGVEMTDVQRSLTNRRGATGLSAARAAFRARAVVRHRRPAQATRSARAAERASRCGFSHGSVLPAEQCGAGKIVSLALSTDGSTIRTKVDVQMIWRSRQAILSAIERRLSARLRDATVTSLDKGAQRCQNLECRIVACCARRHRGCTTMRVVVDRRVGARRDPGVIDSGRGRTISSW